MSEIAAVEMPRYRSHKEVSAAKITDAQSYYEGGGVLFFEEIGGKAEVTSEWVEKRLPEGQVLIGGYYVVYEDGYTSWSPAETFESGYTRISE